MCHEIFCISNLITTYRTQKHPSVNTSKPFLTDSSVKEGSFEPDLPEETLSSRIFSTPSFKTVEEN
jgi:hypothetical protein